MRPRPTRTVALGLLLALAGCDSPTAPSPDVGGAWSGTWQFRTAGVLVTDDVTLALTQTEATASGPWTAASGPTGTLSFNVEESFSGTLTISQTLFTGQICTGTTTVTGTASASRLDFVAAPIPPVGLCQWATDMQFALGR